MFYAQVVLNYQLKMSLHMSSMFRPIRVAFKCERARPLVYYDLSASRDKLFPGDAAMPALMLPIRALGPRSPAPPPNQGTPVAGLGGGLM